MEPVNLSGRPALSGMRAALSRYGVGGLRAAAALPVDVQRLIDKALVRIGRFNLTIVNDLINAGLTRPLPNWLSVPSVYREAISESGHAQVTWVPKARGERQAPDREGFTIPIPCQWDDFSFTIREELTSERVGADLDTTSIEQATRNVNELIEVMAIEGLKDANGDPIKFNGHVISGLLDTTSVQAYIDNQAWDDAGHSADDIQADVQNMIEVARLNKFRGPFNFYYPSNYSGKLNTNFSGNYPGTILQHLRELEYGGAKVNFKAADYLPDDTTLLIQMTSDVVDVIEGQRPTTVSWQDGPGWERFFVVLACIILRMFPNFNGDYGVVKGVPTI